MVRRSVSGLLVAGAMLVGMIPCVDAHGRNVFVAGLDGYEEVPSFSTAGHGHFWLAISPDEQAIDYKLAYGGLSSPVTRAHIHFGQRHTVGGVMVALCRGPEATDAEVPPAPECPREGIVEGTISAGQIVGPAGQGIAPGQLRELIRALRAGAGYVNVHTVRVPSGEIRGQIR